MNVWLPVALMLLAILVVVAGGIPLVLWLTKSIAAAARDAIQKEWRQEEITGLLRKIAGLGLVILFLSLLPWSLLTTVIGGMADQFFRNTVNQWMSGPDLFQHLAIAEDEYHSQPLHWRQALAEISLREGDEDEALRQFISQLDTRQINLLEKVAKYALSGALLELRLTTGDPVREELSHMDLMHLEEVGVIDSVLPLNHKDIRPAADAQPAVDVTDGLWLVGYQYGIFLRADAAGKGTRLSFLVLTETGGRLVHALRKPTSLSYLCWLQRHFYDRQISAEVWFLAGQDLPERPFHPVSEIGNACESVAS